MRGKLLIFFLGLAAICGYVASPFVTAWSIREAIRNGDAAYLEAKVDWAKVKTSLKSSMEAYALGPNASGAAEAGMAQVSAPRPGLWQRIKAAYGKRVVASMVDNMVSPASLPRLFSYRKSFNENVRGIPDEREVYSLLERIKRSWSRVMRSEFVTPTRFAMEMRDKVIAYRSYSGVLELQGTQWRLVHLEVKRDDATATNAGYVLPTATPQKTRKAGGLWSLLRSGARPADG